jgi:hypothetical protein
MTKLSVTSASTSGGQMIRLLARLPWGRIGIGVISRQRGFYWATPNFIWMLFRFDRGRCWGSYFELCLGWITVGFIRNREWFNIHGTRAL